jgi:hypothetical protein
MELKVSDRTGNEDILEKQQPVASRDAHAKNANIIISDQSALTTGQFADAIITLPCTVH